MFRPLLDALIEVLKVSAKPELKNAAAAVKAATTDKIAEEQFENNLGAYFASS
jgi:hypothetical protein